jgi:REP element-mobilizing transposase RayT
LKKYQKFEKLIHVNYFCGLDKLVEYPHLKKRYWGQRFWGKGYGAWSTGNITDKMVRKYLEHHRTPNDPQDGNFILE